MKINKIRKVEPVSGISIGKYKSNSNSNKKEFQKTLKKELDKKQKKSVTAVLTGSVLDKYDL